MFTPIYTTNKGWFVGVKEGEMTKEQAGRACMILNGTGAKGTIITDETEEYIDQYIVDHGKPPTYEEIKKHFGLRTKSAAHQRTRFCRHKMRQRK